MAPTNIRLLLLRALGSLRFNIPLKEGDPSYVARPDGLGQQILNHVMAPSTSRLLMAGPAGCGKSTELLQLHRRTYPSYAVFVCPCDRDLDLYRFDPLILTLYLLWRMLFVTATELPNVVLSPEIRRDLLKCLSLEPSQDGYRLDNPRVFFAGLREHPGASEAFVLDTFTRLTAEIDRAFLPPLLLIDGLEKLPPTASTEALGSFIRSPILDSCQSVIVVPSWMLYGWESWAKYEDTEVFRIPVSREPSFVRAVLATRAGSIFEPDALEVVAVASGGVVRDGLQIASVACRRAMNERAALVTTAHAEFGRESLRQSFQSMFSDDPAGVADFLRQVKTTHTLPGNPNLRNLLLGNGIVLPGPDGSFYVHPCAV